MLDLPDHGYVSYQITPIDPAGVIEGALGGPSTIIDRPGYRYSIQFMLPAIRTADDARIFQSLLERGARDDVSYPWPLDYKPPVAGVPLVNGASPAGSVIPVKGLLPNYQFRQGQPLAVVSAGIGFVHKVTAPTMADASGNATLPVFPLTRKGFSDGDTVEVERPRIRGALSWSGASQEAFGSRPFTFTITERY
jgi:hypothetical protein